MLKQITPLYKNVLYSLLIIIQNKMTVTSCSVFPPILAEEQHIDICYKLLDVFLVTMATVDLAALRVLGNYKNPSLVQYFAAVKRFHLHIYVLCKCSLIC